MLFKVIIVSMNKDEGLKKESIDKKENDSFIYDKKNKENCSTKWAVDREFSLITEIQAGNSKIFCESQVKWNEGELLDKHIPRNSIIKHKAATKYLNTNFMGEIDPNPFHLKIKSKNLTSKLLENMKRGNWDVSISKTCEPNIYSNWNEMNLELSTWTDEFQCQSMKVNHCYVSKIK